ncbi:hypothetical protein JKP88DRAFT_241574 [Tribonema minus]|uniref:Uncharacterized protein n=1 Tax=Tribonema minus TaxID=303371 RepID=A0A836CCH4_9STRA|nr:hypothetical protein JKP88DRAFT_241574 [Tribonema minus]
MAQYSTLANVPPAPMCACEASASCQSNNMPLSPVKFKIGWLFKVLGTVGLIALDSIFAPFRGTSSDGFANLAAVVRNAAAGEDFASPVAEELTAPLDAPRARSAAASDAPSTAAAAPRSAAAADEADVIVSGHGVDADERQTRPSCLGDYAALFGTLKRPDAVSDRNKQIESCIRSVVDGNLASRCATQSSINIARCDAVVLLRGAATRRCSGRSSGPTR